ncbi:hypothetical protein [Deinococcus sonorensis]|uniref:Uncharacterized protein n=2 Tax=Deinococcus sonorensis TaxID=309891 RepID=A0AAU7UA50_9DEIO
MTTLMRTAGVLGLCAALGAAPVRAQLDDSTSCAPLSYVLKVTPSSTSQMQLTASLNGATPLRTDSAKSTSSESADVTSKVKPTGNTLTVSWKVTGDANKRDVRTGWVSLKVGNGSRFTTIAAFRTDYYPGQKTLTFRFDAPPKNSVRCDNKAAAYGMQLGTAVGNGRVSQFTLSVNGHYYSITTNEPSNLTESQSIDLRPFLTPGKNDVRVQWKVLSEQSTTGSYGAQITRTTNGKAEVLAKTVVKARQGETGEFRASITVP